MIVVSYDSEEWRKTRVHEPAALTLAGIVNPRTGMEDRLMSEDGLRANACGGRAIYRYVDDNFPARGENFTLPNAPSPEFEVYNSTRDKRD